MDGMAPASDTSPEVGCVKWMAPADPHPLMRMDS